MVLGHHDERQDGHGSEIDKSFSLSPQIYTSRAVGDEGQGDSYYYPTTWPNLDRIVLLNQSYKPEYIVESQGPTDVIGLALCYTTNFMAPDPSNIFYVIPLTCPELLASEKASLSAFIASFTSQIMNYATPTVTISVTATTTILLPSGGKVILPSTTASNTLITTLCDPVTTSPTAPPTSTGTDAANATGTSNASNSKSSGLSLGAKIGIAFGAIILVFLLLLALLLLLRRRRKNSPPNTSHTPENLLSSSLKNNESRDLSIAEKLNLTDRTDTNTPLTSHGAITPYENDDDLPAPGSAFTANTPVPISPRRSQVSNTLRSHVGSRGISITSGISRPVSPLGGNNGEITISRENSHERLDERSIFDEEPYTDSINGVSAASAASGALGAIVAAQMRSQGDNIDGPRVYKGTLQAPFLIGLGMSAEEVAREEEEERRIDKAIAEAEEERRRVRERRER
ncbi:predicted protein [Sclerotinia sclerotiorum 1980 UF-70]|uniref:Uncharacterized protein n=1 Tax=Sclerotinia sclerotiorum (strain ATCC 18683 / 1980 / Ss-1) TaxID=665079 RepID=A7F5I3_SCLS1|nr:predicted protein [Sclerotinia sclerotiorum 1980 UF-70]EDN98004.1 predicted protein [Sclerotinia sclerotiorum 1980 UF-70]